MKQKIKVGDQLWYATTARYERSQLVTVKKVGRKWLTLSNGRRADKGTLEVDGYPSGASLHESEEAWKANVALGVAWGHIRSKIGRTYRVPQGVSAADIAQAMDLLRLA